VSVSVGIIPRRKIKRRLRIDWSLKSIAVSADSTLLIKKPSNGSAVVGLAEASASGEPFFLAGCSQCELALLMNSLIGQ
jgi:hypothetical protein